MLSCTSVRYVESRQRYSNDVDSYYFLQLHGVDAHHKQCVCSGLY